MAILIHGDASFIGQGVTQETLNLSQLKGYESGGALHVVINNQIGFTTDPKDARSTRYCTDVAKMLQAPVFHVNGEDPEAVAQVVKLAMDFRREWQRDVIVDMYCFRRRGHNETDEPAFTQPLMYEAIRKRPSVRAGYLDRLTKSGHITLEMAEQMVVERRQRLQEVLDEVRESAHRRQAQGRAPPRAGPGLARVPGRPRAGRPAGADGRAPDAPGGDPRVDRRDARRLHAPQEDRAPAGAAPGHRPRRAAAGLGRGRAAGLRQPGPRRAPGAPQRPGQPARHLQPPPLGAARRQDRRRARAPEPPGAGPGAGSRPSTAPCPRWACWPSSTATA